MRSIEPPSGLAQSAAAPIIAALAAALLRAGISPLELGEIAKREAVLLVAAKTRFGTGRPNYSRVAAATGLSRPEVARILAAAPSRRAEKTEQRIRRVVFGWATHPQYRTRAGKPRVLSVVAATGFPSLVKAFGGDIPARAMLDELRRAGLVTVVGKRVRLESGAEVSRVSRDLRRVAPAAADLLRTVMPDNTVMSGTLLSIVEIPAADDVECRVVLGRARSAVGAMLSSLQAIADEPVLRGVSTKRGESYRLRVTAMVSANPVGDAVSAKKRMPSSSGGRRNRLG